MTQVTETLSEGLKREFTVVVAADDIAKRVDERLVEVGAQVRLPGFRPGKIPMNILRSRFGPSVMGEVLESTVQDTSGEVMQERDLRPAGQPRIEIKQFDEGKDLEFDLAVEILPEIVPMDFAAVELTRMKATAGDAEVAKALDDLAQSQKRTEPVAEARPAADGDTVVIDFIGRIDGEAFEGGSGEGQAIELGSGMFIPGFEAQLVGKQAGEAATVKVPFPDDYPAENLAGKEAEFGVTVKELRAPAPATMDDDFAKELGLDDLAALKDMMRERLDQEYGQIARARLKRELLDVLADGHSFDVPPTLVDNEFDQIWQQVEAAKEAGQLDEDDASKAEDELKAEYRDIALRRVRLGLLLADVGQRNGLTVSPEEVNRAMMAEARRHPGHEQQVLEMLRGDENAQAQLRAPLFEEKVVDFIVEMAKIADREVSVAELIGVEDGEETAEEAPAKEAPAKKRAPAKKKSAE